MAAIGITGFVLSVCYFAATGYLVFRDDILAASLARQVRIQQAYEDRIAGMRSDIDRLTSRQLLNQEAFESELDRLLGRQVDLDARQSVIAGLSQAAQGAGLLPGAATPLPRPRPTLETDPVTTGSITPTTPIKSAAALRGPRKDDIVVEIDATEQVADVEISLDALARNQVAYVAKMAADVAERNERIATILEGIGQEPALAADNDNPVGGPFEPLDVNVDPETFRVNVAAIAVQIDQFAQLRDRANKLPLAKPIESARRTSRYGVRLDPFSRRPAMHSGIDFKASRGHPVRAAASGTVVKAGHAGGYGYMIEIDHGRGIKTRYAHLSKMLVKRGAHISEGAVVGHVGSTGRSTGPHLHYEIRIGKKAVDPANYLKAGVALADVL
ncbi:MAG: M23 family metallopeptidase [Hyphomicrobiales bacterium]|nr:M23 family metallopeptidase [Hyphomicrobiales bacterium]